MVLLDETVLGRGSVPSVLGRLPDQPVRPRPSAVHGKRRPGRNREGRPPAASNLTLDCPAMCAKDLRPDIHGLARDARFVIIAVMRRKATHFRPRPRPLVLALLLFLTVPAPAQSPSLKALHVERGPVIDGSLQDEAWKKAEPFTAFRRVFPTEGAPTETTELRVLYDDDDLFLGIYCHDSQPAKVCGNTMAHDATTRAKTTTSSRSPLNSYLTSATPTFFL